MKIETNVDLNIANIQAVGDEIIVLVDKMPLHSEFIICPEFGGRKPVTGVVISVGNRAKYVQLGQRIFFTRFTGREFIYEEKKYQILKEIEIFAVIPEDVECEEKATIGVL